MPSARSVTTSIGSISSLDKSSGKKFLIGQATLGSEEMKVGTLTFVKNGSS